VPEAIAMILSPPEVPGAGDMELGAVSACKIWSVCVNIVIALLRGFDYTFKVNIAEAFSLHDRSAFMKLSCTRLTLVCFLLALPAAAMSAELSVDANSIVRFGQSDSPGFGTRNYAPFTQYLGLDADKLGDGNLSLHFYGWGRGDMADKSFNNNQMDGNFTYGYLQYRFKAANADIRAGRFFVHEGIVNEQIDGASFRSDLPLGFAVSAFGGANVHTAHLYNQGTDGKGDANMGGRLSYRYKGVLELGFSGQYETDAPTLHDPNNPLIPDKVHNHRMVGGDVWFSPYRMVELMGHTSYNTETKGVAEQSYLLNLKPLHHLVLTGEYNDHREYNYAYTGLRFSETALNPNTRSHSLGGKASYAISKNVEVAADYKRYTRENGNADRYGGELKFNFLDNSVRSGVSYYYLRAGKQFAPVSYNFSSYQAVRGYVMHDSKTYFAALDGIGYIFKEKIYNEQAAWEGTLSLGYHITPSLAASGDVSYGRNPQFTEEWKGLVRLTYNMTYGDSKGGMK
jgi:hypothetical protein